MTGVGDHPEQGGKAGASRHHCPGCQLWVLTPAVQSCPNCGLIDPQGIGARPPIVPYETIGFASLAWKAAAVGAIAGSVWGLFLWYKLEDAELVDLLLSSLIGAVWFAAILAVLVVVVAAMIRLPLVIGRIRLSRYEARLQRREPDNLAGREVAIDEVIQKLERQIRSLESLADRVKAAQTGRSDDDAAVARLASNFSLIRRAIEEREDRLVSAFVERLKLQYQRWLFRLEALLDGATGQSQDIPLRIRELYVLEAEAKRAIVLLRAFPPGDARDELLRSWSESAMIQDARSHLQLVEERALHAATRRLVEGVSPVEDELSVQDPRPRRFQKEEALFVRIGVEIEELSKQEERLDAECAAIREVEELLTPERRATL